MILTTYDVPRLAGDRKSMWCDDLPGPVRYTTFDVLRLAVPRPVQHRIGSRCVGFSPVRPVMGWTVLDRALRCSDRPRYK